MRLVTDIRQALRRLERLPVYAARDAALKNAGEQLEQAMKASLSHIPGEDHASPWLRTGELRDSITYQVDGSVLVVGSVSQVAVDQELGTRSIPPRPFLAPTAAAEMGTITEVMAQTVAGALEDQR